MEVVITAWALNSYLNLKHKNTFSTQEYKTRIRPDVELLKKYPNDPKFQNQKFWSPAQDRNGNPISDGFKMKWHQVGNGKVQLRLPIGILNEAHLCEAFVKSDPKIEKRKLARFKVHLELIRRGQFTECGRLK